MSQKYSFEYPILLAYDAVGLGNQISSFRGKLVSSICGLEMSKFRVSVQGHYVVSKGQDAIIQWWSVISQKDEILNYTAAKSSKLAGASYSR